MQDKTVLINENGIELEQITELNMDTSNEGASKLRFENYYNCKIGDKIGNCSIIEKIGAGGGSDIYLAYHNNFGRRVVLKEYKYVQSKIEVDLLLNLEHPHIPSVYDYIEENGKNYLVMEFINGLDLRCILCDGPLDEDRTLKYAIQLCDTVEYLHSQHPRLCMEISSQPILLLMEKMMWF